MKWALNSVCSGFLAAAVLGGAAAAVADKVDIDDLKAEIWFTNGEWHVGVQYEVEVKDFPPNRPLVLQLSMTEDGRIITDAQQRPLVIQLDLDRPAEIDDDEIKYRDVATIDLPAAYVRAGRKMRLNASVVTVDSHHPLAQKDEKIKLRQSPPNGDD